MYALRMHVRMLLRMHVRMLLRMHVRMLLRMYVRMYLRWHIVGVKESSPPLSLFYLSLIRLFLLFHLILSYLNFCHLLCDFMNH